MSYSQQEVLAALELYNKTKSIRAVIDTLGYPSKTRMYDWIKQMPGYVEGTGTKQYKNYSRASSELKYQTVMRCCNGKESVKSVSEEIGFSTVIIYEWIRSYKEKGLVSLMKKKDTDLIIPDNKPEDIESLKAQMLDMQMEIDILKETINVLKKDPGVDQSALTNREKVVIIDALKTKYSLPKLLEKLCMSRSSYYYQEAAMRATDKYAESRCLIVKLFHDNRDVFGYRKIHMLLKNQGITLSEKVIRRIMKDENLIIKKRKRCKYNSYKGEITPPVENIVNRDFHADKPNQKWLTDITEFSIKAGKVYLSPMIDCLDGMPLTWTIGIYPNANLTNTMLRNAIATLKPDEKPIVHSDRGCHYRWPEWISIMDEAGLTRSMSKKGCSPDNSACEGFFGHLKTEMFYGHNWDEYSIDEFIQVLEDYLHWYCKDRIKSTLGGLSPLDYRRSIGVGV